ncbi:hypothetical protein [Clostridium kluyveri]|uniref:hypothetical protein n=1 Tax=Clostridium kluyveri TaxID=1534 RepID=UPI002247D3B1|nr:hypothetical protein [Clostridium kluyveri]UZQ50790.1 hypothetical protein OP486_01035 [Clostridium kluyveri]
MKLNEREKILVVVMIFFVVIAGYYKFVFSPQRARLNELVQQKEKYNEKLQDTYKKVGTLKQRELDVKILNSKIMDETSGIFPDIIQENLILDVDNMLKESNLDVFSFAFSDIKAIPVEEKKQEETEDNTSSLQGVVDEYNGVPQKNDSSNNSNNSSNTNSESSKNDKDKLSAQNITLTLNLKGSYENLMDFIKTMEIYKKRIVIANIKVSQLGDNQISGAIGLEFFAVPKITDEDKDLFKWELNNIYGKQNPFDGAGGGLMSSTIEDIGKNLKQQSYDFVASARPISSELPTFILGKSNDSSKSTYVYGDNPSVENVEIYFTKKGDKYYYKYKTGSDSYPSSYSGDGVEFTPGNTTINFKIYSQKRKDASDTSGANMKIHNNTDKTVSVDVDTDDSTNPRVTISADGGSVEITRN